MIVCAVLVLSGCSAGRATSGSQTDSTNAGRPSTTQDIEARLLANGRHVDHATCKRARPNHYVCRLSFTDQASNTATVDVARNGNLIIGEDTGSTELPRTKTLGEFPADAAAGCRLSLRYAGSTSGTGNVFAYFVLADVGRAACGPDTYPSIRLLDAGGRDLYSNEMHESSPSHPIVLAAGEAGHFLLSFQPLTPGGARLCAPTASGAVVSWAGAQARATLSTQIRKQHEPINPCHGSFSVTPVAAGR